MATARPNGPACPWGNLKLAAESDQPAVKSYRAEFYEFAAGGFRLDFQGSIGKEGFYLPGAFLALLQSCLDSLADDPLRRLTRGLVRLHLYYRYRRDFWEGGALTSGPIFALGTEEIHPENATPEV